MDGYNRLTREERYQIEVLLNRDFTHSEIADELNRNRSTILREIRRCLRGRYRAETADKRARLQRSKQRRPLKIQGELKEKIDEKLRLQLSPDEISGEFKHEGVCVSHETIYQYVYRDAKLGGKLFKHLRQRIRKRKKRISGRKPRGQAGLRLDRRWIEERPEIVDHRVRLGDLERDTMICKNGRLLTIVDRVSKLVWIKKLKGMTSGEVHEATLEALDGERVLSLTNDNGPEFGLHCQTERVLRAKIYFSRPYCSWQRGTNENTNGLIRQYFPKGFDLSKVTEDDVAEVEARLNSRPRKNLGYRSPIEVHERLGQAVALEN